MPIKCTHLQKSRKVEHCSLLKRRDMTPVLEPYRELFFRSPVSYLGEKC